MTTRVIVTRPRLEARKWVDALAGAGYDALAFPLIEVSAAPDAMAVKAKWERLHTYDAAMFVSGNAVDYFFESKATVGPVFTAQAAIKTRAMVTGPGSFSAMLRAHAEPACIDAPDLQAGQYDSEALWGVVQSQVKPGYRVLIVRGASSLAMPTDEGHGRDWFASQVLAAGGSVEFVVAYQRRGPDMTEQDRTLVQQSATDGSVWLFSSSEAITNLVSACPHQSWQQAKAVVTHPRIALAAREAGFSVVCESRPQLDCLMASIESMQ